MNSSKYMKEGAMRKTTKARVFASLLPLLLILSAAYAADAADGVLDPTFGIGGKVLTAFSSGLVNQDLGAAIAIQSDGKIVAVGTSGPNGLRKAAMARYNTDGSLDTTFGGGGEVLTVICGQDDLASSVAIQTDGKIVVSGASYCFSPDFGYNFTVTRYNTDGSLDSTFGSGGKVVTGFGGDGNYGNAVAIQSDGKIVVAGTSNAGGTGQFAIARYTTGGSLDSTFGSGGKKLTSFGGTNDNVRGAILQPDGKIVAAGASNANGGADFALARYNPSDGSLDSTFGSGGKVLTDLGGADDSVYRLAIQVDGKIVAGGWSNAAGNYDFALARYNPSDGSLDSTFGSGGKVLTDFSGTGSYDSVGGLAIQADGKIVAAGYSNAGDVNGDFALARYNSGGSLDSTFGSGGKVLTDFSGSGSADNPVALAIQADGKIVAAGYSNADNGHYDFALARYQSGPTAPTSVDQCKNDGWKTFTNPSFRNQGDCVSYVVSKRPK